MELDPLVGDRLTLPLPFRIARSTNHRTVRNAIKLERSKAEKGNTEMESGSLLNGFVSSIELEWDVELV